VDDGKPQLALTARKVKRKGQGIPASKENPRNRRLRKRKTKKA
jgi:hypothetical protein